MAKCRDVAELANVSVATVSYVFSPEKRKLVTPETCERVMAAAAKLGYQPSPVGRSLANRRTYKIGLLFSQHCRDAISKNQLHILHALTRRFVCSEYDLSIYFGWNEHVRNRIVQHALDGIILIGNLNVNTVPDQIAGFHIPMVVVNRRYRPGPNIGVIDTDYDSAVREWVRSLVRKGKKRIYSISRFSPTSGNGTEIRKAIERECAAHNLQEIPVNSQHPDCFQENGDYADAGFLMFAQQIVDEAHFSRLIQAHPSRTQILDSTIVFSDQFEHSVPGEWWVTDAEELGSRTWMMMQRLLQRPGREGALELIPAIRMEEYRRSLPCDALPHDF